MKKKIKKVWVQWIVSEEIVDGCFNTRRDAREFKKEEPDPQNIKIAKFVRY